MITTLFLPILAALILLVLGGGTVYFLNRSHVSRNKVSEMTESVSEGLKAFFQRVLGSIFQLLICLSLVLFLFTLLFHKQFHWVQVLTFLIGGSLMGISTYVSLSFLPRVVPVAVEQSKGFLPPVLLTLLKAGSVVGYVVVGLMIMGLMGCYIVFGMDSILGFGLGVICAGFFLRVGGGIYKAATDIGSTLIQRIDSSIPRADRRSPATVLEVTGHYVSSITGFSSDMMGSYIFAIIACMVFPLVMLRFGELDLVSAAKLIQLPLVIVLSGVVTTFISVTVGRIRLNMGAVNNFLLEGVYVAVVISAISMYAFCRWMDIQAGVFGLWGGVQFYSPFWPFLVGLVGAMVIGFMSEVLTSSRFMPAKQLVKKVQYGPSIVIFSALSAALKGNGLYGLCILLMICPTVYFFGFYGIAMVALGMLCVAGPLLIAKAFTPMAQHVNTMVMITNDHDHVLKNAAKINRIGYTTVPLGNGLAAASAVMATLGLFFPGVLLISDSNLSHLFLLDHMLLSGLIMGMIVPFVFSGFLLHGLYHTVLKMFSEVSRQFREIPYLYSDQGRPDIVKAVDTLASRTMDSLFWPGLLMAFPPIFVGFVFGEKVLIGLVLGVILSGFSQSFYWANFGDSLKEAKSYMEQGHYGGQESPTFGDMEIADSVGAAFRELLSPSMNNLIKSVTIVALLVMTLL